MATTAERHLFSRFHLGTLTCPLRSSLKEDKSPTAKILRSKSLEIISLLNAREISTAYSRFASPDHTYTQAIRRSSNLYLDLSQTQAWMKDVVFRHPETHCDVLDLNVDLVEKMGVAIVWITMRIKEHGLGPMDDIGVGDGGVAHWGDARQDSWPGVEKVSLLEWRRENDGEWKWTRHQCLSAMPPLPY